MAERPPKRPLLDLASLGLLALALGWLWPTTAVPAGLSGVQPPWWGGFLDLLLEGPDAGEWAINAARVAEGQARQVDHHRMPTWLLATGALHRAGVDLVTAGHLVNRAAWLLLAGATWLAGRLALGPGTALLAATLAAGSPHLRLAAERYGIDVAVGAAVAVVAAAGLVAGRWPRVAPLAGVALCAAALTHFTTLPLVLPGLLLAAAAAAPGARWRAAGGLALGLAAAALLAAFTLRLPTPGELVTAVYNGLPASAREGAPADALGVVLTQALSGLARGLAYGPADLLHAARPPGTPWVLVVLAGALGLVGGGLRDLLRPPPEGRAVALAPLGVGLALACVGTGAVLLAAVGAPERYTSNLAPIGALLLARGCGGLVLAAAGRGRPAAEAAVGLLLAALALPRLDGPSPVPGDAAVGLYLLTAAVERTVPPGAPLAVAAREVAVASGHPWCSWPLCSAEAPGSDPAGCMARIRRQCGSDQPLGWISLPGWQLWGAQNTELQALDAWVGTELPPGERVEHGSFVAELRVLPPQER